MDMFIRALIPGIAHVSIGQEGVAVGVCAALRGDDYVTSTHRGHGHCIAKGARPGPHDGRAARQGDRLLPAARAARCTSPTATTGSSAPTAIVGGGIADRDRRGARGPAARQRTRSRSASSATARRTRALFHECAEHGGDLEAAGACFVCENNQYARVDARPRAVHGGPTSPIAATAYGIPSVHGRRQRRARRARGAHGEAVARARAGEGPTLLECDDLPLPRPRHRATATALPDARGGRGVEARDPIERFASRAGGAPRVDADAIGDIEARGRGGARGGGRVRDRGRVRTRRR